MTDALPPLPPPPVEEPPFVPSHHAQSPYRVTPLYAQVQPPAEEPPTAPPDVVATFKAFIAARRDGWAAALAAEQAAAQAAPPRPPPPKREGAFRLTYQENSSFLEWRDEFLATLRRDGVVRLACEAVGVSRRLAYYYRNLDPDFRKAWDEAVDDAVDVLETVARQRALDGSDGLLIFLMRALRPAIYNQVHKSELTGRGGGPVTIASWADLARAALADPEEATLLDSPPLPALPEGRP